MHSSARYSEKLLHPRWLEKRSQIIDRDFGECVACFSNENLEVHHEYYEDWKDPWDYPDSSLKTLCHDCHTALHARNHKRAEIERERGVI